MSKTANQTANRVLPQTTYLAIGIPQGVAFAIDQPQYHFGYIRRGGVTVQLPETFYQWWTLALDGAEENTIRDLAAKQNELENFSENLAFMVELRLLLPWTGDNSEIERFPEIRVVPAGVGLGNSREDPFGCRIVSRWGSSPGLSVDLVSYTIWSLFDGAISLEQACQTTAKHLKLPLDSVRQLALILLPLLMRNSLAMLDVVTSS
jgi:hypothetical protein